MSNIADEKKRMLIKVSTLYYIEGLNQQEIADRLQISRPQVSRMLSAAKTEGIVNISINNPYAEELEYERAILEAFGIKDVIVINATDSEMSMIESKLAKAGAALLESVVKDKDTIAVMASRSIGTLGTELEYFDRKGLNIVPLVGGWGPAGAGWHANENARVFGEKLKSRYWLLNAPAVVVSVNTRNALLKEPEINEVLNKARNASIALIGIGQVSDEATIVKSGFFSKSDMEEVKKNEAVANICASFMDDKGNSIDFAASSRMIGLTVQEIRKIPEVIAIASGSDKVQAITATLRGKWIDVLVTDIKTAKSILDWHGSHPVLK